VRGTCLAVVSLERIWTALETEMFDLTKDRRTRMKTLEIRYNQGVADRVFTEAYLQKPQ
jgi:hypothetical protein